MEAGGWKSEEGIGERRKNFKVTPHWKNISTQHDPKWPNTTLTGTEGIELPQNTGSLTWSPYNTPPCFLFLTISRKQLLFILKGKSPHRLTKADKDLLAEALPEACSFNITNPFLSAGPLFFLHVIPPSPVFAWIISIHHQTFLNAIFSKRFSLTTWKPWATLCFLYGTSHSLRERDEFSLLLFTRRWVP